MRLLDPKSLPDHTDRLFRAAWALCGSREDAEDLVQETFTRVLARPRLLRGDASDATYLLRTLRNVFLTGRRDAGRRPDVAATLDDVQRADPRTTSAPGEAAEMSAVYEAISRLPEHYRSVLIAVDLVGLSYGETAAVVGVREQTVASRLFRARGLVAEAVSPPQPGGEETPPAESV